MQPDVDEVGRDVEELWPATGRVGHHQPDPELAQQRREGRGAVAVVPDLQGVPQRPVGQHPGPGPVGQPLVVASGQVGRFAGGGGQPGEEVGQPVGVESQRRRQLPQQRSQLVLQGQHPGAEEVGQRRVDVAQLLHVGDEAAALDREHEARRGLGRPAVVAGRPLQGVERAVDLDRGHPGGRVGQLLPMRQALGVEVPAPGRIDPAGDADPGVHSSQPRRAGQIRASRTDRSP